MPSSARGTFVNVPYGLRVAALLAETVNIVGALHEAPAIRDLLRVAALLAIALPRLPLRREGDRDLLAVEGEMLQTPFKWHSPSPAYAGVFDPGRKHSLLPAWAKNMPPAYFLNASRPPQREPRKSAKPRGSHRRCYATRTVREASPYEFVRISLFARRFVINRGWRIVREASPYGFVRILLFVRGREVVRLSSLLASTPICLAAIAEVAPTGL